MSTTQFLIRGSQKVISHYQFLLDTAESEQERETFANRIEEEKRNLERLLADLARPAQAA
ncbi:hypothetical protein ABIF38_006611 [Bradyrhizobium japonicum]|jgi:hypothetical protein|uniref:Uncharacterized protein n=1 Tax=Bradyrhizobium elkanii TaxID=29448 RepID=A0A1E3EKF1_BRAEL|nr:MULTISPECIES: hypothetical protein [Bradyrhizobium]MBP1297649.1 hypothetical protein [Bradyrhizobium elkanii]MBP2426688.1 hypothetical protein [Bradyrhizobium elkanii]MCP1731081.1 hypothetical protein [Bradyrhizobium elkanii]MCP1758085.1 hypothetical protein [Bradyrhizobium elkanii]MCP1931635.1 hypothetical protein [Bradyrhizobium elkanii]